MDIQTALITALKCLITVFFGYKPDWIKYLDRSTGLGSDWTTQRKFWTGLGLQNSPICSTLLYMTLTMILYKNMKPVEHILLHPMSILSHLMRACEHCNAKLSLYY